MVHQPHAFFCSLNELPRVSQSLVTGFEEVYPLWALSTADVGGLEWSTMQIGKVRKPLRYSKLSNNTLSASNSKPRADFQALGV